MNWYSFLGVGPDATTEQVTAAVERLSRQANALAVTAPERARQLRDQIRAIKQDLLSGPESRRRYDHGLLAREPKSADVTRPRPPQAPVPQAPGLMSRISKFLQTGWTCVGCGYGAQPTDKFCPKCGGRVESGLGGQLPRASGAGQAGAGSPGPGPETQVTRCGRCGTRAAPGDVFCMRCGNGLSPGTSRD